MSDFSSLGRLKGLPAPSSSAKQASQPQRLKPEDISYLALEGGGGKGFAYLGALQLMQEHNILAQLKGVAGTSAGAITALMISLGMSADDIANEINTKDFNKFFDLAEKRLMPEPCADPREECTYIPVEDDDIEKLLLALFLDPKSMLDKADKFQQIANRKGPGHLFGWIALIVNLFVKLGALLSDLAKQFVDANLRDTAPPLSTILFDLRHYLTYLDRDMGLFCGLEARKYFDNLIATRAAKIMGGNPSLFRNMPFVIHNKIFKKELLVCGANLSTFKTTLFSARSEHTPLFPVADAIRISMGLPLIYKPYIISQHFHGWPPCGTYVDGGLWNNIPLREIEPHLPSEDSGNSRGRKWPRHTLALRLDIDQPKNIMSAGDVVAALLSNIIGAGETQLLKELEPISVMLDTRGLSLLKFKPDDNIAKTVRKRSRRAISEYFGWEIAEQDMDEADDKETKQLKNMDICNQH